MYTKFGHGESSKSKHGYVGAWGSRFRLSDANISLMGWSPGSYTFLPNGNALIVGR